MNRCLNNICGDCKGKPKLLIKDMIIIITGGPSAKDIKEGNVTSEGYKTRTASRSVCKLDRKTCGLYQVK